MKEIRTEEARMPGPKGFVVLKIERRLTKREKELDKVIRRIKQRSKKLGL
jgi:hypothetical protein